MPRVASIEDLDLAIRAGDWTAAGATAALLDATSDSQSFSSRSRKTDTSYSRCGSSVSSVDAARAADLDRLVDEGDWDAVVRAAAKFKESDDLSASASHQASRKSSEDLSVDTSTFSNAQTTLREIENLLSEIDSPASQQEKSRPSKSNDPPIHDAQLKVSSNIFEMALEAAKVEDGDETILDRIMLDEAMHSEQERSQPTKLKQGSKETIQENPFVKILQQMITHEEMHEAAQGNSSDRRSSTILLESIRSEIDLLGPDAKEFIRRIISTEFPSSPDPTLMDLINVGPGRTGYAYKPGEWVEIQGAEMSYRIQMITRVLKLSPPNWDWNDPANEGQNPEWMYFYHAGNKRMIEAHEVRSPKEGLVRIFGQRPWIWQQWACLKLEHTLRFQEGHQDDFMSKDVPKFATDLWERWLNHPLNHDFRKVYFDDRVGDRGRQELVNHIMTPFTLLDKMKEDKEDWNFHEETRFSVFTYLGLLGSGYIIPIAITMLQVAIPGILIWNLLDPDSKDLLDPDSEETSCPSLSRFGYTNECGRSPVSQAMSLVVLLFYLFKVVPDTVSSFYDTTGAGVSVYSRLVSLRRQIWTRGDDRLEQLIGFRMDIYMNTGYVNLLYMLNIFIIINTDDAFEILLNALAFEFVIQLDNAFVQSVWWDPGHRWIMAGSMEIVLQSVILQSALSSAERFAESFHVTKELALRVGAGDPHLFRNYSVAEKDVASTKFMTNDETVKFLCKKVALETNNKEAIVEYQKPRVFFGCILSFIKHIGYKGGGVFDRYASLRTWSRWEEILYVVPVPDVRETLSVDSTGKTFVNEELSGTTSTDDAPFENLDQEYLEGKKEWEVFCYQFLKVLCFQSLVRFCRMAWRKRKYSSVPWRAFDCFLQWLSFVIQIVFPVYTIICLLGTGASIAGIGSPNSGM